MGWGEYGLQRMHIDTDFFAYIGTATKTDVMLLQATLTDSTLLKLSQQLSDIENEVRVSPLISLVAAALGGILVWVGQYIERKAAAKTALRKELFDLFTHCEMLLVQTKNTLKELATQKNLRVYWWYCYADEANAGAKKDAVQEKKYLEKHDNASDAIIQCTLKIGTLLSEYYSMASKFKALSSFPGEVSFIKTLITDTDYADAKEIPEGMNNDAALAVYEKNTVALSHAYINQFAALDRLNDALQNHLK